MKLLFKNTTQYNQEIYDKFLQFHQKKYGFRYKSYTVFIVALILFATILQIKYHNFTIAICLCCAFTFFILWRYFHPIAEVSKEYKSDKIQKGKSFTFKFYDKFFIISNPQEFSKVKYYKLYRVFETIDFFYLYSDKTHAFIVDKSKFKNDSTSAFSTFIKKKCWWCFKKL